MSTNEGELHGESSVFGVPTRVGPWALEDESTRKIVWRRDLDETDLDPADGEEKPLWEWVVVAKVAEGGAWRAVLRKGFADTTMLDRPELTRIEQKSATDEGREAVIEAAIDFMLERGGEAEEESPDEDEVIAEVIAEQEAEEIGRWRRVDVGGFETERVEDVLVRWQDEGDEIIVFVGRDMRDGDAKYSARAESVEEGGPIGNKSIKFSTESLETALDEAIQWIRYHRPGIPMPTFSMRIEGGILKPLADLIRRLGGGTTLVEVRDTGVLFESSSHVNHVEFLIPQSDMAAYEVEQEGELTVDSDFLRDALKPVNFSDEVPVSADAAEDPVRLGVAGRSTIVKSAVEFFRRGVTDLGTPDASFTIDGLEYRDKTRAAAVIEGESAIFGRKEGVVFMRIEDSGSGEEFTARIETTEAVGEQVVIVAPDRLQDLRRAMPRPSQTPITFSLKDNLPMLAEYTVGETDVDVRIALKTGAVPVEIEVPPAEVVVPEGIEEPEEAEAEAALEEFAEAAVEERETVEEEPEEPEAEPEPETRTGPTGREFEVVEAFQGQAIPEGPGDWRLFRASVADGDIRVSWGIDTDRLKGQLHVSPAAEGGLYSVQFNGRRSNNLGSHSFEGALNLAQMVMDPLGFEGAVPTEALALYLTRVVGVGRQGADTLGAGFPNLKAVRDAGRQEVGEIDGIGDTSVDAIFDFDPDEPLGATVEEEPEEEPEPEREVVDEPEEAPEEKPGVVTQFTRQQVKEIVEAATVGTQVTVQVVGSELREIKIRELPDTPVPFRGGVEVITTIAKETPEQTVLAAIQNWEENVNVDDIPSEEREETNDMRGLVGDRLDISIPRLTVGVPPPEEPEAEKEFRFSEAEVAEILEAGVEGANVVVDINPDADSVRIRWDIPSGSGVRFARQPQGIQGIASDPVPAIIEALEEWQDSVDLASVDREILNERRDNEEDEFGIELPEVPGPAGVAVERGEVRDLAERIQAIETEFETVPIDVEDLEEVPGFDLPVEVDQEGAAMADEEERTSLEQALEIHHSEEVHDAVHEAIATVLDAEPESFYDSSKPSELPGYDLFYSFDLSRSSAPGAWTNRRFDPSTLFRLLEPFDGSELKVVSSVGPLA